MSASPRDNGFRAGIRASGTKQQRREAQPPDGRQVPCEAKRAARKDVAAEQSRQVGPPEQANQDVPLAEVGVRRAERAKESGGTNERDVHGTLFEIMLTRRARQQ